MADIFISYSSKDRAQAEQLTELLASAGLSVWIDRQGIDVATSWSKEIVQAIDGCKALVVLLSPNSVESVNVVREVSLASERKKKILPLDLEPVSLPDEIAYHLAGIQRTAMTNIDSIIRALGKLGLEATKAPELKLIKATDARKSLMILPFEDLSPTQDNQWFADGLASELVNSLSYVKALKLIDWNTAKMLRNKSIKTVELAKEFNVRYFLEGQVRKFGDQIKISITLLDIETGDHLWQDSMKGMMEDIFDIQETAARNVVEGLKVHLGSEEMKKFAERGTENVAAYECYIRGTAYYERFTLLDFERSLALYEEAVRLDPNYTFAYAGIANTLQEIFRNYSRNSSLLDRAESAATKVLEVEGETARYWKMMGQIALRRGHTSEALVHVKRAIAVDPNYASSYDVLSFVCKALGDRAGVVAARKEDLSRRDNHIAHFNLLSALNELVEASRTPEEREANQRELRASAERAIPVFERYKRLNPDNYSARAWLANIYRYAGRKLEAAREADELSLIDDLDGFTYYNLACLYVYVGNAERGIAMLEHAVEKGLRDIEMIGRDPDLDPIREMPKYAVLLKELKEKIDSDDHG